MFENQQERSERFFFFFSGRERERGERLLGMKRVVEVEEVRGKL